jgi:tetrahydromethanopterin S-methyltransferase subunit B
VTELWLGVIAVAVVVMAVLQVGAAVAALRLARRVDALTTEIQRGIKPVVSNLTSVSGDAARAATLAADQVARLEQLVGDLVRRADETMTTVQRFVQGPARDGAAVVAGVRAAIAALRGIRDVSRRRRSTNRSMSEEEDSLFIG